MNGAFPHMVRRADSCMRTRNCFLGLRSAAIFGWALHVGIEVRRGLM